MNFFIFPSLNARCDRVKLYLKSWLKFEQLFALEKLKTSTVGSLFPFLFLCPYLLTAYFLKCLLVRRKLAYTKVQIESIGSIFFSIDFVSPNFHIKFE